MLISGIRNGESIMKKYILVVGIIGAIACTLVGCGKKGEAKVQPVEVQTDGTVAIGFDYTKRSGYSSNQYAIWIEDEEGDLVKTVCATQFTAQGGYEQRAESIPIWVKKSGISTYDQEQMDAITTATPNTGKVIYLWDLRNEKGEQVSPGVYTFFVEATIYKESRVLYTGEIDISGGECKVEAIPEFTTNEAAESDLIVDVYANYLP